MTNMSVLDGAEWVGLGWGLGLASAETRSELGCIREQVHSLDSRFDGWKQDKAAFKLNKQLEHQKVYSL